MKFIKTPRTITLSETDHYSLKSSSVSIVLKQATPM